MRVIQDQQLSDSAEDLKKPSGQLDVATEEDLLSEGDLEVTSTSGKRARKPLPRWAMIALRVLLFGILPLLLLAGMGGFLVFRSVSAMMGTGQHLQVEAQSAYDSLKAQNLPETKQKLDQVETRYHELRAQYNGLGWVKYIPIVRAYYIDGEHGFNAGEAGIQAARTAVAAIEPYADVLGFAGEGTFEGGSVENRVKLALTTLSKIEPVLDELTSYLDTVESELGQIDERRYPEEIRGIRIRDRIIEAKEISAGISQAVVEGRPALKVLPSIAGAEGTRKKYLIIFQNDNEIRPTGGFMTAYATLFIEDGVVTPEKSDDIYELDQKFRNKPAIPDVLKQYLTTETRWNLRDMNMSPDFHDSMDTFWSYMQNIPGESKEIDGIIAVDTHVLTDLVRVLGPVEVPGYGTFSAETDPRCDCPQIIYVLSEIVDRPTPYLRENRKGIIGPMMQAVLAKAYAAPKQSWPDLFSTGWKNIEGKHIQFYFFDETIQQAAEAINVAGRVHPTPENSDYLLIVDANLGGAKSNLFIDSSAEHEILLPQDGKLEKTVTVTYKNTHPASNCNLEAGQLCLNGELNDWFRMYVPKGSELITAEGFEEDTVQVIEELDHTVIEGVFTLSPMSQTRVKVQYRVPYAPTDVYRLYMQKQGGTEDTTPHLMIVNGSEHLLELAKDTKVEFPF